MFLCATNNRNMSCFTVGLNKLRLLNVESVSNTGLALQDVDYFFSKILEKSNIYLLQKLI